MKLLFVLLGIIVSTGAFAEDVEEQVAEETAVETVVVDRVSCSDMSARMTELSAIVEPDEVTIAELETLKSDYRIKCSRNARARKRSGREAIEVSDEAPVVETETVAEEVAATESVVDVPVATAEPEITPEQVKANLESGLCADGAKPNKYGCCADELFKDMGNMVFACCPKQGGDCYPPIK